MYTAKAEEGSICMKIKVLFVGICAALCVYSIGYATEITSVSFNGSEVLINGKGDEEQAVVKIIPKNAEDNIDNIAVLKGVKTDSNKEVSVSAVMPEISGTYSVFLKSGTIDEKEFSYANMSDRQLFIDKLNTQETDVFALLEEENSKVILNNFGVNVELYASFSETQKRECIDKILTGEIISKDNIKTRINTAAALTAINNNIKVSQNLSDLELEFESVKHKDITDAQLRNWIEKLISANVKYQSRNDLEKEYRAANILYLINNAKYTEYDNLITGYDSDLQMTSDNSYKLAKQMSLSGQTKVNEYLKNALSSAPAESIALFKTAYQTAYWAAASESGNAAGGGGSSSGGSSSKNNSSGGAGGVPTNGNIQTGAEQYHELSDIGEAKWAEDEITFLHKKKIISGYDDNTFGPNNPIKREEFVTIIINAVGIVPIGSIENTFTDVKENSWYEKYILTAVEQGYVSGMGENLFGTGECISRQDAAVILYRVIKDAERENQRIYTGFADDERIAEYAKEAVKCMFEYSIINGAEGNMFNPQNNLTRAEAAKMIYNALFWREAK